MNSSDNTKDCSSFSNTLKNILILQKKNSCINNDAGCDRPYLGPNSTNSTYNTRPITLYNCCTGVNSGDSTVFRLVSLDD